MLPGKELHNLPIETSCTLQSNMLSVQECTQDIGQGLSTELCQHSNKQA